MRCATTLLVFGLLAGPVSADLPLAFPDSKPQDDRLGDLQNLNGYFPFRRVENIQQWRRRQAEIRRRILVSQGLWPLPTKSPIHAVIHGRVERDAYVVDRVYFQSAPGHFVTGSLYRPKHSPGPLPAVLSPHGHWKQGRFYDAGQARVASQIEIGAESFPVGGRYPIQARAVQLARMGCVVFVYDMTGNADSIQIEHRPSKWKHLDRTEDWGFMSVQADLRLQNMMGLQTWNSIRAIDFLLELDEVDPQRIGVTGASGGGTQSMIIAAIDKRIAAAMPCVMVSTAMQGGCTCENAPLLRVGQGNIDIAAATAPRPLGLTAADDWTIELETKGYPDLVRLYELLGHGDRLTAVFHTQFKHNYNQVNRAAMYSFFNRHFELGLEEPIVERDFVPLSIDEATVWTEAHPAPDGDRVGDLHQTQLLKLASIESERQIRSLIPQSPADLRLYREVVGGGWETILGRRLDEVGDVAFTQTGEFKKRGIVTQVGHLDLKDRGEQIPMFRLQGDSRSRGTVLWITNSGKAAIHDRQRLADAAVRLVDEGYAVLAADLFGQGEFLPGDQPLESQRMWYQADGEQGWQRFSGYTYGYNHCMFARRVHDVLSLIQYARSDGDDRELHLVGLGEVAGPLVVAARSQAAGAVAKTFVDLDGFRFQQLSKHDDPMFVPGAVKYLDVDGLLSLCAPAELTVFDRSESTTARQVYRASEAGDLLNCLEPADPVDMVVQLVSAGR
jgi:dienelactone hydrolase